MDNQTDNQKAQKPGIAGKIIVALVPFSMVTTYFLMQSGGVLFQKAVMLPYILTLIICVGGFMAFIALLAKLDKKPGTQKLVSAFFMTTLVIMGFVVFKLNGLF